LKLARGKFTGGRVRGVSINKRTRAMRDAAREALGNVSKALGDQMEQLDSLGLLQVVYRCKDLPLETRMQAATAALRYERPALAQSSMDVNVTARRAVDLTDDQLAEFIARGEAKQLPAPGEPVTIDASPIPDDGAK
jgi:hypothetical protein